jgi:hypothetical protein
VGLDRWEGFVVNGYVLLCSYFCCFPLCSTLWGVGCVSMLCLGILRFFVVVWIVRLVLGVMGMWLGCVPHE